MATKKLTLTAVLILASLVFSGNAAAENIFPKVTAVNSSVWGGAATGTSFTQQASNFTVFLPWIEWNETSQEPVMYEGYLPLMSVDGDFFLGGPPSAIKLLSYEYVLNITDLNSSSLSIYIQPNDTSPGVSNATSQSLAPISSFTIEDFDFETNSTFNMSITAQCPFLQNETCPISGSVLHIYEYNSTSSNWALKNFAADPTANITFDFNSSTLGLNVTNRTAAESVRTFKFEFGLYDRSIGFVEEGMGPPPWMVSPVSVQNQSSAGIFEDEDPPEPGQQMTSSVQATFVNTLYNYTAENVLARFFLPYEINMTSLNESIHPLNSSTVSVSFFNCTSGGYSTLWSPSGGPVHSSVINSTSSFNFTDDFPDSPSEGETITMSMYDVYVNLSAIDCLGNNDGWNYNDNLTLLLNATFSVPEFDFENTTSGNEVNVSTTVYASVDEQAIEIGNSSLPEWSNANTSTLNVSVNGDAVYQCGTSEANNKTLNPNDICWEQGSVIVRGLETGTSNVKVSYQTTTSSSQSGSSSSSSSSSGGATTGGTAAPEETTTTEQVAPAPLQEQPGTAEAKKPAEQGEAPVTERQWTATPSIIGVALLILVVALIIFWEKRQR